MMILWRGIPSGMGQLAERRPFTAYFSLSHVIGSVFAVSGDVSQFIFRFRVHSRLSRAAKLHRRRKATLFAVPVLHSFRSEISSRAFELRERGRRLVLRLTS